MSFFNRKRSEYPRMPEGDFEPVLRCSICTGEQTLCARDRKTGKLHELMLISTPSELEGFCAENDLRAADIKKVY